MKFPPGGLLYHGPHEPARYIIGQRPLPDPPVSEAELQAFLAAHPEVTTSSRKIRRALCYIERFRGHTMTTHWHLTRYQANPAMVAPILRHFEALGISSERLTEKRGRPPAHWNLADIAELLEELETATATALHV